MKISDKREKVDKVKLSEMKQGEIYECGAGVLWMKSEEDFDCNSFKETVKVFKVIHVVTGTIERATARLRNGRSSRIQIGD